METWMKELRERLGRAPTAVLAHIYEDIPRPVYSTALRMVAPEAERRAYRHPEMELDEQVTQMIGDALEGRQRHRRRGTCPRCGLKGELTILDGGRAVRAVHRLPRGAFAHSSHCYAGTLPPPDEYQGDGGPYEALLKGASLAPFRRHRQRFQ